MFLERLLCYTDVYFYDNNFGFTALILRYLYIWDNICWFGAACPCAGLCAVTHYYLLSHLPDVVHLLQLKMLSLLHLQAKQDNQDNVGYFSMLLVIFFYME